MEEAEELERTAEWRMRKVDAEPNDGQSRAAAVLLEKLAKDVRALGGTPAAAPQKERSESQGGELGQPGQGGGHTAGGRRAQDEQGEDERGRDERVVRVGVEQTCCLEEGQNAREEYFRLPGEAASPGPRWPRTSSSGSTPDGP